MKKIGSWDYYLFLRSLISQAFWKYISKLDYALWYIIETKDVRGNCWFPLQNPVVPSSIV